MPSFTTTLLVEGQEYSFHFSEIMRLYASRFHVQVTGSSSLMLSFDMSKGEDDSWMVCPPAPQWIVHMQSDLSLLIQQAKKRKPTVDPNRLSFFNE